MIQRTEQKLTYNINSKKPTTPNLRKRVTVTKCFQPTKLNDANDNLPEINWFYDPQLHLFSKQCTRLAGGPHGQVINIAKFPPSPPTLGPSPQQKIGRKTENQRTPNKTYSAKMTYENRIRQKKISLLDRKPHKDSKQSKTADTKSVTTKSKKLSNKIVVKLPKDGETDVETVTNTNLQLIPDKDKQDKFLINSDKKPVDIQTENFLKYVEDLKTEIRNSKSEQGGISDLIIEQTNSIVDELRKEINNEKRKNYEEFQKQVNELKHEIECFKNNQKISRKNQSTSTEKSFLDVECNTSRRKQQENDDSSFKDEPGKPSKPGSPKYKSSTRSCPENCTCFHSNEPVENDEIVLAKLQEANLLVDRVKTTLNQLQGTTLKTKNEKKLKSKDQMKNELNSRKIDNFSDKNSQKEPETQLQIELHQEQISKKKDVHTNTDFALNEGLQKVEMETKKPLSVDATTNTLNHNSIDEEKIKSSTAGHSRTELLKDMPIASRWYSCVRTEEETECYDLKSDGFTFYNKDDLVSRPKTRRGRFQTVTSTDKFHSSIPIESSKLELNVDYLDPAMMSLHDKLQTIGETSSESEPSESIEKDALKDSALPDETGRKAKKLSVQQMPSINIRSGLKLEPTLNLSINPDGVVHSSLQNKSNINYGEIVFPEKPQVITESPNVINEVSKSVTEEPSNISNIKSTESVNKKVENEMENTRKKLKLIKEKLNTNPTFEGILEMMKSDLFAADKTKNHANKSTKLYSSDSESCQVPPAESLSETTKNSNEVVENKTTNIKRNSNLDSNVSDSSSAKRKMDDPDASNHQTADDSDIDKLSKNQTDNENEEPSVPSAFKLLNYGFLHSSATQCDLTNQFPQDDVKIVENPKIEPTTSVPEKISSNNDKTSDESVEFVINVVSQSENEINSNEQNFEKQFDLKKDVIKDLIENEEPVKDYSTDTSADDSTSKSRRVCSERCKKRHSIIDQSLQRCIDLKNDLLSKNINLDHYEIKNRDSIGISPRILSKRNKLKLKQLTDSSVTESLSEGEIRAGNVSVGEVLNRKDPIKQNLIHIKKFPKMYSIANSNIKIEQHKHYFNNWVTYFINEGNNDFVNDSSSASSSYK